MTHIDKQHIDYTLYLVTDRSVMSAKSLEQAVEQAIQGGCTVVQLREKNITSREFFETAQRINKLRISTIFRLLSMTVRTFVWL